MRAAATAGWLVLVLLFAACAAAFGAAGLWPLAVGAALGATLFGVRTYGCATGKTAKLVAAKNAKAAL